MEKKAPDGVKFTSLLTTENSLVRQTPSELCGIGRCTPEWLQRFADPKAYLVVSSILGVLQGAYFTYFVGVISTLEKRYAFESKITGIIMIADNFVALVMSTLVGYYAGRAHKPRLIALGMLFVILGCFLSAVPYFVYGPALHLLSENSTVLIKKPESEFCDGNVKECSDIVVHSTTPAVVILIVANFFNGFGYTAFYTIGAAYLDDNVRKKNSPVYFSVMSALRIFGPALGFLLSSFCLQYYEDPFYDPGISQKNPRWVGAWWMGFIIMGVALLITTVPLIFFPRHLPKRFQSETKTIKEEEAVSKMPRIKDYPKAIKRLLKNPILVCHTISVTFQVNGFAGYFVFMPKYMESQYHQTASSASLFSGATGIIAMLLGILIGGLAIKKFKPRPRYLTGYMVLVEMLSVVGLLISIFLGCPPIQMPGTTPKSDETLSLYNDCNVDCGCTMRVFEPVCGPDGVSTFFSPCFAGCPNTTSNWFTNTTPNWSMNTSPNWSMNTSPNWSMNTTPNWSMNTTPNWNMNTTFSLMNSTLTTVLPPTEKIFNECKCLAGPNSTFVLSEALNGFCSLNCNMFVPYIILLSISKFISSTARVGNTLILFRSVDAKDKSFALGTFGSTLSAFAFIPFPLIYGALTDASCIVWEESCSKTGNCWLYDSDKFRVYLHGMSIVLILIGICFDGVVFLLSDRLTNFYGEDEKQNANDRIVRWLREEEEEDIVFTKVQRQTTPMTNIDAVM